MLKRLVNDTEANLRIDGTFQSDLPEPAIDIIRRVSQSERQDHFY